MEEQVDTQRRAKQGEEYWRGHVERSKSFAGTLEEYCLSNGVSKSSLHRYRQRFGAASRKKRSAFVKVARAPGPVATKAASRGSRLPDPRWVAELLMALGGDER